jgi:hypothetical protein
MGHGSSKEDSPSGSKEEGSSRISHLKQRLHLHRHHHGRSSGSSSYQKILAAGGFAGIALLTLIHVCFSFSSFFFFFFGNLLVVAGGDEVQGQVARLCFSWRADLPY